jgi:hypothetical protein
MHAHRLTATVGAENEPLRSKAHRDFVSVRSLAFLPEWRAVPHRRLDGC